MRFKKISSKLTFLSVLGVTLSVLSTGTIGYLLARGSILYKLKSQDLIQLATNKAEKVSSKIYRAIETSNLIATDPTIIEWFRTGETNTSLGELAKKRLVTAITSSDYTIAFAANVQTKNYWKNSSKIPLFLAKADEVNAWFFRILDKKERTQINISTDGKGDTYVFINILMDKLDDPVGVAGVSMLFNEVAKEFNEINPELNSKAWLIDSSGKIRISSTQSQLSKKIGEFTSNDIEAEILKNTKNTFITEYNSNDKGLVDVVYVPLKIESLGVVYEIPRSSTTSILRPIAYGTVLICTLSIIFILILFYYGTRTITEPIQKTIEALNEVSKGNIKQRIAIESKDELGDLAKNFNIFSKRLTSIAQIVKENSEIILHSSKDITLETKESSINAQSQAAAVDEISATIGNLFQNVESVAQYSEVQSNNLESLVNKLQGLSKQIEEMNSIVIDSTRKIKSVSDDVSTESQSLQVVNNSMKEIYSSSSDMLNIIEVIRDISEKINLLALNASIEAARAGQFGKGFAVVAMEISKLAEQTAESVKNIDTLIKKNNKEIQTGIDSVDSVMSKTKDINTKMDETVSRMNEIFQYMQRQVATKFLVERDSEEVQNKAREIYIITSEVKHSFEEIIKAIQSINSITHSNLENASLIAEKSESFMKLSKKLRDEVEFFKI
jgi:methyl-accepting chemotaxis protein